MGKDDLRGLREKLGVNKKGGKGNTLVGHATPSPPPPPEPAAKAGDDEDEPFDMESTLQLSASDIELVEETAGEIIEADLGDEEPPAPPRPPRPPTDPGRAPPDRTSRPAQAREQTPSPPLKKEPTVRPPTPTLPAEPEPSLPEPPAGGLRPPGAEQTMGSPGGLRPPGAEQTMDVIEVAAPPTLIAAVDDESELFLGEASALAQEMPERAGLMRILAAAVLEDAGRDADEVVAHLDEALELGTSSPQVVALVRNALMRLGRHDRVLALTETLLELGGDNRGRVAALLEAAAIKRHQQGDSDGAVELLEHALELEPGAVAAQAFCALLHLETGHDAKAVEALEGLAESLDDATERSLALTAAGALLEHRLEKLERAEQDYARAVESDPQNVFALLSLRELHLVQGSWRELAQDVERIAALAPDGATRSRHLLRAGSLHLDRTADLEAASRTLVAAAEAAPEEMAPLTRLAQVYEETGRYKELVETLWRLLDLTLDPRGKPALLCRIGWLLHQRLGQADDAIEAYRRALAEQPGYLPALLALGTLYRQHGDYEGLVTILAPEAEGTDDLDRRAVWCLEVGEICHRRLGQREEAVRYYRRALELCPGMWVAFWRLHDLLVELGWHDALAAQLKQRSEVASDPKTRNYLLLQLARLQAGPLNEIDQAVETMQAARSGGECRVAGVELAALYERSGQYAELASLLLDEAGDTKDPDEARGRRLQAAALLDDNLGEHDRALEIYRDLLEQNPREAVATHAAGRMYHRLGRWKDLLDLHRRELEADPDRGDAAELLFRIGRLHEEHLGQFDDAIASYMEALERDPTSTVALEAVIRLVRSDNRRRDLVDMLERHAGALGDPAAAADALCRAAEIAYGFQNDTGRAVRLYDAALERIPGFRTALHGLLDLRLRQKKLREAAEILGELVGSADSDDERGLLIYRQARLRELRLGEKASTELYDEAALACSRGDRLRLEQLRARWLDGADLGEALQAAAQSTEDDGLAAAYWLQAAEIHELAGRHDQQLAAAEQAFKRTGDAPAASWCLQRALRRVGEVAVLAALVEQQAEREPDSAIRLAELAEAVRAHLRVGATAEAGRIAAACLELDAGHLPSLNVLGRLAASGSRWEELAALRDRMAAACVDRGNRLQAALQASDLWAHRVNDPARALASLQPALADEPGQPEAFARAERLLQRSGRFDQLSKLYTRRILSTDDPDGKVDLLRLHARMLHHKLGDTGAAVAELGKLLALRPGDLAALSERADLLCSEGRWSDAAEALETLVEKTDDAEQRRGARLLQAQVWINQLHQPGMARQILSQALEDQPEDISVKQGLVQVAFAEGKWEEARQLLDEVAADHEPHVQVWALTRLAEVAHVGLRDETQRSSYEREALLLAGGNPPVLEQVIDRYRERGEQKRLVKVAADVLEETTRADVASTMRLALARVMLEDMKQPAQALEWLRESLVRDPNDKTANLLFARALEQQGEMEQAVARYRQLLEGDPLLAEAYRGLSRLASLLGHPAVAAAALGVLELMGEASAKELEMLEVLDSATSPGGQLEVTAMPADPALHPLRRVFNLVLPHLGSVFPLRLGRPLRPTEPVALSATRLATALGLTGVQVAVEGDVPAASGVGDPVPLQVGADLAGRPKSAAFRFWVGRALAFSALGGSLTDQLSDRDLGELFEALFVQRPIDPGVAQLRKQILRVLPRKTRKSLEQLDSPRTDADYWTAYRAFARRRSDEVGLLVCGNPRSALAEITGGDGAKLESVEIQQILLFIVSEEYGNYHRSLWSSTVTA